MGPEPLIDRAQEQMKGFSLGGDEIEKVCDLSGYRLSDAHDQKGLTIGVAVDHAF